MHLDSDIERGLRMQELIDKAQDAYISSNSEAINSNSKAINELKREVKSLRTDVSTGKGMVKVLVFLGTIVATIIGVLSIK